MLAISLGRRYERLLFFTAPVSIACLIVFFISLASTSQKERVQANCYAKISDLYTTNIKTINKLWSGKEPKDKYGIWKISYKNGLSKIILDENFDLYIECDDIIMAALDSAEAEPPSELISRLRRDADKIFAQPIQFYGVEIPDKATVNLIGTDIQIGVNTANQIIQIGLAPVMLLWLGSLFNTRYRETLLIARTHSILEIFPHVINVYGNGRMPQLKKRSWVMYHFPKVIMFWCSAVRLALLAIFIIPPVSAYALSLYFAPFAEREALTFALGAVVALFGATNLMLELFPWNYSKIFANTFDEIDL